MAYPSVFIGGKSILTHRYRAEQALGRPLPKGAIVHHADGSTRADAPLVICQDQKYHLLLHIRERVLKAGGNPNTDRICCVCHGVKRMSEFYRRNHKNNPDGISKHCKQCDNDRALLRKRAKRRAMGIPENPNHHMRREVAA